MKALWASYFLPARFFYVFGTVAAVFVFSFFVPWFFPLAQVLLFLAIATSIYDGWLLYQVETLLDIQREMPEVLTLGDELDIAVQLHYSGSIPLNVTLLEELPFQLGMRHFKMKTALKRDEEKALKYTIRPTERGLYDFGNTVIFLRSPLGVLEKRHTVPAKIKMKVYPSILQMKHFEMMAFSRTAMLTGVKRIRRIGHSYEFEQIKNYSTGDDYRSINWKATGRRNELMVNQYEDERSQHVYCIIDKSRNMKLPFNGLTLMDHAINTALVISNIALRKYDKSGLVTFSDRLGAIISAERKASQMNRILETLYKEQERPVEANYELLYHGMTRIARNRSLLFLFTNFESVLSIERVLPILRRLNKRHLLVVVFFENTEITAYSQQTAEDLKSIFLKVTAQRFVHEKIQIVQTLRQFGIQTLLTRPDELSLNTVNKYLELKARGLI